MGSLKEILSNYAMFDINPFVGIDDPTWKERHAKGVPVKILSQEDHDSWYQLDTDKWYEGDHIVQFDNPVVRIYNFPMSAGLWDRVASFRNFRYKPEWLEKKKAPLNQFEDPDYYQALEFVRKNKQKSI